MLLVLLLLLIGRLDLREFLQQLKHKERGCTNSRNQRKLYTRKAVILLTSIIDFRERRDVATTDIPVAYLNADMDNEVIIVMEGCITELMVQTAPKLYRQYLGMGSNNKLILYVKLQRALYGCLKSASIFY
eukprot:12131401-Ditylum_brightwellii.AAC.1